MPASSVAVGPPAGGAPQGVEGALLSPSPSPSIRSTVNSPLGGQCADAAGEHRLAGARAAGDEERNGLAGAGALQQVVDDGERGLAPDEALHRDAKLANGCPRGRHPASSSAAPRWADRRAPGRRGLRGGRAARANPRTTAARSGTRARRGRTPGRRARASTRRVTLTSYGTGGPWADGHEGSSRRTPTRVAEGSRSRSVAAHRRHPP